MKQYPGQLVFGLDIGTRSIVGTVGYYEHNTFHVVAHKVKEHETRAMLDGQIHDIVKVSETIKLVKDELEKQLGGRRLKEVCIAAAGRVLKTIDTKVERRLSEETLITPEMIYSLDLQGVEKAYEEFQEENQSQIKFYCVGYTIVKYFLNDYPITNLENHKAKMIGAQLIATFLPDEVVDGLYKAVQLAGLQVANLTLEPIAAIQVAIPQMYRMLNIALVDVGAGTSDICITRDGSVVAYGMIPSAGDEITELIARECLVDFAQAEKIKTAAGKKAVIKYKDIMGIAQKITPAQVVEMVKPVVAHMTKEISDKMKELNGEKSVSAVFVVGGGGKIPGFTESLAKELSIHSDRVAIRGEEVLKEIDFEVPGVKKDSLLVTPIGICLNFYDQKNNFIFVNFNREQIKLYDNNKLAIVDCAMQANFPNEALFPRRGKELNYTINGKHKMQRGELGEAAVITLNGETAGINTPIHAGDKVIIKESTIGAEATLEINQLVEYDSSITVVVNEKKVVLPKFAEVNGQLQSGYYDIKDGDNIKLLNYYTVGQIAEFMDVILKKDMNLYVNNKKATLEDRVFENFSVIWTMEELKLSEVVEEIELESYDDLPEEDIIEEAVNVPVNIENVIESTQENLITDISVIVNGSPVRMTGKQSYIYVDIFDQINFDLSVSKGKAVATLINGRKADYTELLHNGDVIEIYWIQ
ncbi:MAG: cell division FtsA domain-containing protein [Lachnospiraceae bacterium]|nr:cell division FtsA domain-containing protein [Lachnospiraceae bacterium]